MRLVFMGTPQFAVQPLRSLAAAGHEIVGAVTRIDKPAGRGRVVAQPPVKHAAQELGIPVFQPKRVRDPEFIALLRGLTPEAIVVAAFGQILPKDILTLPPLGCVNIHASLLPRYRGAAPINWAIIRGEREAGVTIMQMDEGMDTGAILLKEAIAIEPQDTAGSLTEKLATLGASLITRSLSLLSAGKLTPIAQDNSQATLAPPLKKEEGLIDWGRQAMEIHNRVRGLSPWPGAYTYLAGALIKVIETEVISGNADPGLIGTEGRDMLAVGTGSGLLRILRIQLAGKKPMTAAEFLRGHRGIEGKRFEARISEAH